MILRRMRIAHHSVFCSSVVSESEVCAGDGGRPDSTRYGTRSPFGMLPALYEAESWIWSYMALGLVVLGT